MSNTTEKQKNGSILKLVNGIFPELFNDVVGQSEAKKRLSFYLRSYKNTRTIPNLLFTCQTGNGKTLLARETGKGLLKFDDGGSVEINAATKLPARKKFVEISCSTLGSVNDFIATWIVPYVQDKDVTVFFDEASEIPHDISMALLTILAPNVIKTQFAYQDYVCDFDFTRQSFIFATSEPQGVFHALLNRLKRIDLQEYTLEEIKQIIQIGSASVNYGTDVLDAIASVSRGNARNAQDYAAEVKTYLGKSEGKFGMTDWIELKSILSIMPLGLNNTEITILRHLQESPDGTSLTCLAAKMGMSREALQRDGELYLQKHSLMSIEAGKGRVISGKGQEYLKKLDAR
jgi:Holliday junction resolvasome RuvABC ATP-dependent DNA helicase subunit